MEIEKECVKEYFVDKSFSEFRYSISLMFNCEYVCDVIRCDSPDVGRVVVDALQKHFGEKYDGAHFVLDDNKPSHDLSELLEEISADDE